MALPAVSDEQFRSMWARQPNAATLAETLGVTERAVQRRRARMVKQGYQLNTVPLGHGTVPVDYRAEGWTFPRERRLEIQNGSAIISSDHHYWPGDPTVAHKALLEVIRIVKPRLKVLNGDVFDGGRVGRHPPFGWSKRPTAGEELHACQERVGEIEQALPRGCERHWNIGNHCLRFERNLATNVPEYAGVPGMRLADHFPGWEMAWSLLLNADGPHPVMVKHRHAGGVHAAYNNTMKGGLTVVTGHTHLLEVKPWGDWNGRRWGIQCGTLGDMHDPQFEYHENGPSAACPGFVVLTFVDGQLAPPELCEVIDGKAWFRGKVVA